MKQTSADLPEFHQMAKLTATKGLVENSEAIITDFYQL